jgi:tRNA-dihydrouridine synthase
MPEISEDDQNRRRQAPTSAITVSMSSLIFNERVASAWMWWNTVCLSPKWVLGPMIGQSERAFRILCREVGGVGLCYSPMYLTSNVIDGKHDDEIIVGADSSNSAHAATDRPLLAQLAGNIVADFITAANRIKAGVDGIDLNFGCPQRCAEVGEYGAYLLESDPEKACQIVRAIVVEVGIPVTVKMRLLPGDIDKTIEMALKFQNAGASAICIHGRYRSQREHQGPADWHAIREVKSALRIPVIANGSIRHKRDGYKCLEYTKVDAIMSATGLLRWPSLFVDDLNGSVLLPSHSKEEVEAATKRLLSLCYKYLDICRSLSNIPGSIGVNASSDVNVIRNHLIALLQSRLMDVHQDLWSLLTSRAVETIDQFVAVIDLICSRLCGALLDGNDRIVRSMKEIKSMRKGKDSGSDEDYFDGCDLFGTNDNEE